MDQTSILCDQPDGTWLCPSPATNSEQSIATSIQNESISARKIVVDCSDRELLEGEAPGLRLFDRPELYDAVFSWDVTDELGVLSQVIKPGERVVEYGCGTGRLLLPFLEAGVHVDGVDSSAPALEYLLQRWETNTKRPDRPTLVLGDITEATLLGSYDHAYAALNTVRYLSSFSAVKSHMGRAALSVSKGGKYMLHLDSFGASTDQRSQLGSYAEWTASYRANASLNIRWELQSRRPLGAGHIETERVQVRLGDITVVDELQSQLALSISDWQELFSADGWWHVEAIQSEDGVPLESTAASQAPSGNYWYTLVRTSKPTPPWLCA